MGKLLLKCEKCHNYTFQLTNENESESRTTCLKCNGKLKTPHPPKFSMDNKYAKYIRAMKRENQG